MISFFIGLSALEYYVVVVFSFLLSSRFLLICFYFGNDDCIIECLMTVFVLQKISKKIRGLLDASTFQIFQKIAFETDLGDNLNNCF